MFSKNAELLHIKNKLLEVFKSFHVPGISVDLKEIDHHILAPFSHSGIVFSFTIEPTEANPKRRVINHILVLEAMGCCIPPRNVRLSHAPNKSTLPLYVGLVDKNYWQGYMQSAAKMMEEFKAEGDELTTRQQVLPAVFNWSDATLVQALAIDISMSACQGMLERSPEDRLQIHDVDRDQTFAVKAVFARTALEDFGVPVRSDLHVDLTVKAGENRGPSAHCVRDAKVFAQAHGFMDLLWVREQQIADKLVQRYLAEFVISKLNLPINSDVETALLGLLAATSITRDNGWHHAFVHQVGKYGARDIRMSNLAVYEPYSRQGDESTKGVLQVLEQGFEPGVSFAMDLSLGSSLGALERLLLAETEGDPYAQKEIIKRANAMTGGLLAREWDASDSVILPQRDKVHLGYFIDSEGQVRDIREIDNLYLLSLAGPKDPALYHAYTDTFNDASKPGIVRLAIREDIYRQVAPCVVFTGYAYRVRFNPSFLSGFSKAAMAAGLRLPVAPLPPLRPSPRAGAYFASNAAYVESGFLFDSAQTGYAGNCGY